jgi:DNA polymerase-3 subunit epsilon
MNTILAFVDLETTGATPTRDRITEIGIVEVMEDGLISEWSTLVNPETSIPGFIQSMTGITDAMVANAPTFAELAGEVIERLQGRLFIAHNARFDYGFLKNEFRRIGMDFRATVLCTVKLSRKLYPQFHKHGLDVLIERHGLRVSDRHRALGDAQLIHQFWNLARAEHPREVLDKFLKELTARPNLPVHIDPGIVEDLPEGPGVYLFHGENALPLYVGKAKNLQQRVLSHFTGDHSSAKEMSLAQQIRRIDWIETGGEIGALLKEAALIKQLQPTHNQQLRRNMDLCAIRLIDQGAGLVTPEIVFARDLDFGRQANLYGLFKHRKEAEQVLRDLADAYNLCHSILGLEKVPAGKPCFAHQLRKCKGACIGKEIPAAHTVRLVQALAKLHLKSWPFAGPAMIKEGEEVLVVDHWCYLGSVKSEDELWNLLEQGRPQFDRDTYRILAKVADRLKPLGKHKTSLLDDA